MLKEFLKEKHTDGQGSIMIDDSPETLKLTAELIRDDSEIDFECIVSQLLESDEIREFCESIAVQNIAESIHKTVACDAKAESLIKETVDRLLRAG